MRFSAAFFIEGKSYDKSVSSVVFITAVFVAILLVALPVYVLKRHCTPGAVPGRVFTPLTVILRACGFAECRLYLLALL